MDTMNASNLAELAQEAIDVQDACNLCGVAQRFAEVMRELTPYCPQGTMQRNTHPIAQLWVEKLADLARIAGDFTAYDACKQLAETVRE